MKKSACFISLLLLPHTYILPGQVQSVPSAVAPQAVEHTLTIEGAASGGKDIHIHNRVENNNKFKPTFNPENTNTNSNTNANTNTASAVAQATSKLLARLYTRIEPHMQQLQQISPSECSAWATLHKKEIFLGCTLSTYCGLCTALIRGNRYVNRSDLWANWKPHMTAQEMQECPQHELQKSLIEEILKRYLSKATNRLACYLQFMQAIEQEEKRFKQHLMLAQIIRRSMLMRFFPINDEKIKRAIVKQKRLAFIKHIFISWAAQQPRLKGGLISE